jgi:hypothetical protein
MRVDVVRAITSWMVLIVHVLTIFSAPFFIIKFESALDVILILLPLTGLYVGIIVQYYSSAPSTLISEKVNLQFAAVTIFLTAAFCLAVIGAQALYYQGTIESIDQLKRTVGIIDTALGVYTGYLIKVLF